MDEQSGNLADETAEVGETTEVMSESAPNQTEELRKRRSTRIMQAVPLTVSGVDALGRPFTERTSTLIINCHGCRYQSKHYVLKNMWVTLEVPHPEAGQPPRTVRGRVAWIQRPRTVRQLFQVALELEQPGNSWGIAFPPPDWFAPIETAQVSITQEAPPEPEQKSPETTTEIHLPLNAPEPAPAPAVPQDNLRVFPAPASTTDASLQLARHVARLLADAKQQIQATAHEMAAQAIAAERRVSMEEWEQKFSVAREQLAQQVASSIDKIQQEAGSHSRAAHAAAAEALQRELPRWIAPQLEELTRQLTQQISDRGTAVRAEHLQQIAGAEETVRKVAQQTDDFVARVQSQAKEAASHIADRADEALRALDESARQREVETKAHREALSASAAEAHQQITNALSESQTSWKAYLINELEAAQSRWQSTTESTFSTAQDKAAASLDERLRSNLSQLQEETNRQSAASRESLAGAAAEAEKHVAGLHEQLRGLGSQLQEDANHHAAASRESMAASAWEAEQRMAALRKSFEEQCQQLEAAIGRAAESNEQLNQFSSRLENAQAQAVVRFESQVDDVLTLHRNELHRSSETLLEEINTRIQAAFEEACQLAIARFDAQAEAIVQPHMSKTEEAIHRLAGGRSLLDAALTMQQDRIRASADEAFAESLAHFRENLGGVDQLLQEAAQVAASRNLAEVESKISDLKHHTVDDLIKSAEWYEKRAQTQIQGFTEKSVEQADTQLREKAGEVSATFAAELDHSSRSFLGHTQTQMEEVVRDAFEQARALFAEAADTTTAAFTDEIQRQARQELDGFSEETRRDLIESRLQLDAARAELAQKVTAEQETFLHQFQSKLGGALDSGVANAAAQVQASMSPLLDAWNSTVEAHRKEMGALYEQLSRQAAEQHRTRLENVSNQWMLATVASLDHQSREAIAGIAAKAEEKLRESCAQVFAGVGETLRDRLQQVAANLVLPTPPGAPTPPLSKSTTAGGGSSS
ncbi:MAG TPA: hypothetical protein VE077_07650 [Candidatus Methylomirabilis sp.]|nr:hypothetical protein [Candidatus Methylomirabilis sp.]